jgi:thymidylate synthase ThyX
LAVPETSTSPAAESVVLADYDPAAEAKLAAMLLFRARGLDHAACATLLPRLERAQIEAIVTAAFTGISAHDTALREFETVQYVVEIVCSEACLHQLIRHRMSTILVHEAAPALGVTVPPPVVAAGLEDAYWAGIQALEAAYAALGGDERARIVLANGHNQRVVLRLDARELIELSRLRNDRHAQWEIRDLSIALVERVRAVHPLIARACGGRDAFKAGHIPLAMPAD